MVKINLYVGLNDKNTKTQLIDTMEAFKIVTNIISSYTTGGTIYNATGIYKHENGSIVIENTLKIELIDCSEKIINSIIETLKKVLNQETVLKQIENINCMYC